MKRKETNHMRKYIMVKAMCCCPMGSSHLGHA